MKLNNIYKNREYITRSGNYSSAAAVVYQYLIELQRKQGYSFASDTYLANICGLSKSSIQKIISQFANNGFIKRETNGLNRKIYLIKDVIYPEFNYMKDEKDEESVIEPVVKESVEDDLDNIVKDLPSIKPPAGLAGPIPRKKKTKSKEERNREKKLKIAFEAKVYDIYPVDKRGVQSKMFTLFKNLPNDDIKMLVSNTSRYVELTKAPYHQSLRNYIEGKLYTDDAIESITKQQDEIKRRERDKNGSSTALRRSDWEETGIEYFE